MVMPQSASFAAYSGIEDQRPAVDRRVVAEPLLDLGDVVADADGAPHVDDRMLVAGIVGRRRLHQARVHVLRFGSFDLSSGR